MNITRETLLKIIQEEYAAVNELGPETGHEPGTAPLKALQEIIAGLAEISEIVKQPYKGKARLASNFSGYLKSISRELQAVFDELSSATPMQESDESWPTKRHPDFDRQNGKGPNTTKTDFPAGAASEYPKMQDS